MTSQLKLPAMREEFWHGSQPSRIAELHGALPHASQRLQRPDGASRRTLIRRNPNKITGIASMEISLYIQGP
jgi:hypothetical protein